MGVLNPSPHNDIAFVIVYQACITIVQQDRRNFINPRRNSGIPCRPEYDFTRPSTPGVIIYPIRKHRNELSVRFEAIA